MSKIIDDKYTDVTRTGNRKMKKGTKPNLNPWPISKFISNLVSVLLPFFIFPFPALVYHAKLTKPTLVAKRTYGSP